MNIFINILFLFIYLYSLFFFQIPNLSESNPIINKLFIFIAVFVFQFCLTLIEKIKLKCKIEMERIVNECLIIGLLAVLGYSIYNDLTYLNIIDNSSLMMQNKKINYLYVTLIIILFVCSIQLIKVSLTYYPIKC